jgi:hypothetical protein
VARHGSGNPLYASPPTVARRARTDGRLRLYARGRSGGRVGDTSRLAYSGRGFGQLADVSRAAASFL